MNFTASIALALATVLTGTNPAAVQQPLPQAQTTEAYVNTYFANEPVMIAIASCESHFHQYNPDGTLVKNPKSTAVGVFQIMDSVHSEVAADLGIDIYTTQGNAAYAQYLYQHAGTAPWNASKACWGKTQASKDLALASK
jgi:hypothetical protein